MLIAAQCPDATRVAGFSAWKAMGRAVRRGERGIRILAPIVRTTEVVNDAGDTERRRACVNFKSVAVFDVSQTAGDELPPAPAHRLEGEAPATAWETLAGIAAGLGYELTVSPFMSASRNGDCDFAAKVIRVAEALSPAQRVKTLVHELAHALLHDPSDRPVEVSRAVAELEAESVAYVVCGTALSLDTSEYSLGYGATWAGGSDSALKGIRESGDRIARASKQLLHLLDQPMSKGEEAA